MKIFIALVLGVLSFGIALGLVNEIQDMTQVRYITKTVYVDRVTYVDKPVEVIAEKVVTKEVEVEVIRYIKPKFREFNDLEELTAWVKPRVMGLIVTSKDWWDCDDFAERLQIMALRDGYLMSITPVYLGDVWKARVMVRTGSNPLTWGIW